MPGPQALRRLAGALNPLANPGALVAGVMAFVEEAGQHDRWYLVLAVFLANLLAVLVVTRLVGAVAVAATVAAAQWLYVARGIWRRGARPAGGRGRLVPYVPRAALHECAPCARGGRWRAHSLRKL